MGLDLFRVIQGIDIQTDDLSSNVNLLVGTGLPGGDGAEQDNAPIGSTFHRVDSEANSLQVYYKFSTANNSSADWKSVASQEYVDAVAAGISWREPVRVRDGSSYADSSVFPTTGIIDGISLNVNDRVLFTNVTLAGENNVFIWNGSTWTEDSNQESDGDAVLVQEGSSADQQWVYDGSQWVLFGSSTSTAELGYIRDFVGKTGPGAELPSYTSTDVITQSDNLEVAVGKLDNAMGTGEITNNGGNFAVSDDMSWAVAGTLEVTDAINNLNDTIGDRTYTNDNVVVDGETIASSINSIDTAIGDIQSQTATFTGTGIDATAGITLDTIPLAQATEVKWMIQVRDTAIPANRRAVEIHALNDGNSLVDHTEYGVLRLGGNLQGFRINVIVSGTDMLLQLTVTSNIDYVVRRIGYTTF